MGTWGIKAIESDTGLNMLYHMSDYFEAHGTVNLSELINQLKNKELIYPIYPASLHIDWNRYNDTQAFTLALSEVLVEAIFKSGYKIFVSIGDVLDQNFDEIVLKKKDFIFDLADIDFLIRNVRIYAENDDTQWFEYREKSRHKKHINDTLQKLYELIGYKDFTPIVFKYL